MKQCDHVHGFQRIYEKYIRHYYSRQNELFLRGGGDSEEWRNFHLSDHVCWENIERFQVKNANSQKKKKKTPLCLDANCQKNKETIYIVHVTNYKQIAGI